MTAPISLNLDALDGIRGICSCIIVVGHLLTFWVPRWNTSTNAPAETYIAFGLEYLSPVTFFVIASGFTLVAVYDKTAATDARLQSMGTVYAPIAHDQSLHDAPAPHQDEYAHAAVASAPQWGSPAVAAPFASWPSIWSFLRNRLARLAAMYYLGLALGLVPFIAYSDLTTIITASVTSMLAVQSIFVTGIAWDGPLWTVSAFVLCYIVFIRALRCLRGLQLCALLAIAAGVCGTMIIAAAVLILIGLGPLLHVFGPLRVPQFIVGLAVAYAAQRTLMPYPTLVAEACSAIVLANVALCAVVTSLTGNVFKWYITYCYGAEWILPAVHAVWIWALASPGCGGPSKFFLTSRPLLFLGDISYALYCLHWPVLNWCTWAVARAGVSAHAAPMYTVNEGPTGWFAFPPWAIPPLLAICMVVATLAHYAVEVPCRVALSGKAAHGRRAAKQPEAVMAVTSAA